MARLRDPHPVSAKSDSQTRRECEQYCENATDCQLANIYNDEASRAKRGGEVGHTAKIFRDAAKAELESRNLWPL